MTKRTHPFRGISNKPAPCHPERTREGSRCGWTSSVEAARSFATTLRMTTRHASHFLDALLPPFLLLVPILRRLPAALLRLQHRPARHPQIRKPAAHQALHQLEL